MTTTRSEPKAQLVALSTDLVPYLLNRATNRFNQRWMVVLRDRGLTVARWQVLSILSVVDGARVGLIAEMAGNEQPVVSRVVDQMERDRLVERRPAEHDQRAVEVWLTPAGRAEFDALVPSAREVVANALQNLTLAEAGNLQGLLERILESLDQEDA